MSANRFGHLFSMQSFGESHGPALGTVIEGLPAGIVIREDRLQAWMNRRRPGQSEIVSTRQEADQFEILSGVFEGRSLGTPLAMIVRNLDARSQDYEEIKKNPRPGHADQVWKDKFGHVDPRGGGRSSGRETLSRVFAGGVAEQFVKQIQPQIRILGWSDEIGPLKLESHDKVTLWNSSEDFPADVFPARFPSPSQSQDVEKLLYAAKEEGKSYGGCLGVRVLGLPKGLGQPVFHKLKSDLAAAALSLGASVGLEWGSGFAAAGAEGSEFHSSGSDVYGGLNGGISNGDPLFFRVAFKPTSSVLDIAKKGRHDPCIVPRAVPVMEAMTWLILADHLLWHRLDR